MSSNCSGRESQANAPFFVCLFVDARRKRPFENVLPAKRVSASRKKKDETRSTNGRQNIKKKYVVSFWHRHISLYTRVCHVSCTSASCHNMWAGRFVNYACARSGVNLRHSQYLFFYYRRNKLRERRGRKKKRERKIPASVSRAPDERRVKIK